jgi:aromatic-L-amino-acid decarboxylase
MSDKKTFHMDPEEFRKQGYKVIDWLVDYMSELEEYPVLSNAKPGDIYSKLPASPPKEGELIDTILEDLNKHIMPGITHWQSPNFFAFFPANASGPAILGDLISSGLGVQGMLWATSPACTEVETLMLDWLQEMLGLPAGFRSDSKGGGVIQDSASSATLSALLAARCKISQGKDRHQGVDNKLIAYTSDQGHSSIEKSIMIAGIGTENLRVIESDDNFAMVPEALEKAIKADLEAGNTPFFVSATVGTTSSNGIDPLDKIGPICRTNNLWLHVDAAMSGTAAICPEFRWIHNGLEFADSYCFNPHKWMFTNFDCDAFFVQDRAALIQALSILPEYLRNQATESGAVFDYRDWQIPLGRRFRALKLWFVIRHYGVEGLQHHIREHVRLAQNLAAMIAADNNFELIVEPPLNLICFRFNGNDEKNMQIMDACNQSGKLYFTHTKLNDRVVLRLSIGGTWTTDKHVQEAWQFIKEVASNC